MVVWKNNFKS